MLNMGTDELQKLINAIAPARLENTVENAAAIASYVKSHKLPHNAESCLKAVNALLFVEGAITWDIPPAKLASRSQHEAKIRLKSAQTSENEFAVKKAAAEAADKKAKKDAGTMKAVAAVIDAYTPIDSRTQRIAF